MSNAFGIIASNIFQQISSQFINVTNAQEENRLHGTMLLLESRRPLRK